MEQTTSFAKNKAYERIISPPTPKSLEKSSTTISNSNEKNQTIPGSKPTNNNLPTDIISSTGKVVLINKNDTLHQIVVPDNVVLSQDAGPAQINIPDVGPVTIKIDPGAKDRRDKADRSEPLYLEYETPQDTNESESLRGFTEHDIKIAEEQYDALKSVMEEFERDKDLIFRIVPGGFGTKRMKLDKSLSVLIDRNKSIETMCRSYKE